MTHSQLSSLDSSGMQLERLSPLHASTLFSPSPWPPSEAVAVAVAEGKEGLLLICNNEP